MRLCIFQLALSDAPGEMCIKPAFAHTPDANWGNGQLNPLAECAGAGDASRERVRVHA